ncbi:hypothetical protein [Nonlabens xiamenensis]|uniref:hypothetical protein n=1 Tax=Nonlabens xiamenensis TaxID=2341043 RepID=UPI000F60AB1B|nr:hypothetical protein [Nonlabens xiamenensis]
MKYAVLLFFMSCVSINAQTQDLSADTVVQDSITTRPEHLYAEDLAWPYIKIGVGTWLPQGKMADFQETAFEFELSLEFPSETKKRSFEFGIQFIPLNQQRNYTINTTDGPFGVRGTLMMNGFMRFKKYMFKSSKAHFEMGAGIGISSIFLDTVDVQDEDILEDENTNTILFIPGLAYLYEFEDESKLILGIDLQYSPYQLEGSPISEIGSMAVIPKVSYRF